MLRRQAYCAVATAALGGTGIGFASGSLHEGIFYGVAVFTGLFAGLGLSRLVK